LGGKLEKIISSHKSLQSSQIKFFGKISQVMKIYSKKNFQKIFIKNFSPKKSNPTKLDQIGTLGSSKVQDKI